MKEKKSEILEQVVQTPLGYYELLNKPTQNELNVYYSQKYYQNEHSNYRKSYSEEEINYFRAKNEQKLLALHSVISELQGSMLDIGCGEAFTMAFFKEQGWATTGLDYSHFGCEQMNPQCLPDLITGDIYMGLKSLISQERKFTVIWASNVLEHVLDPVELLLELKHLLQPGGVLVIQVPNDFSFYQSFLLENKDISEPFWVAVPDHISYFTHDSLKRVCEHTGWKEVKVLSDFPIDIFLLNEFSNYQRDPSKGRAAHEARIKIENLFHAQSPELTNQFYQGMAELGFGRQITGYFIRATESIIGHKELI